MSGKIWNTNLYEDKHSFVWEHGETLLELLAPKSSENILDLGCGMGQLSQKIANTGAKVIGIDRSAEMIVKARQNYPDLQFEIADATDFQVEQPCDAVFSNAVLHWVQPPEAAIDCIAKALKPKGRFVAEFGGKGNVDAIVTALKSSLKTHDLPSINSWYFPSIAEYTAILEQRGLEVTYASLFDRPTPLQGDGGMADWIEMFAGSFLAELSPSQQDRVITTAEDLLRPKLFREGTWIADYRRIRIVAIKEREVVSSK